MLEWAAVTFRLMLRAEATSLETPPEPAWRTSMLPRQARCQAALATINRTLDGLIAKSKRVVSSGLLCVHTP